MPASLPDRRPHASGAARRPRRRAAPESRRPRPAPRFASPFTWCRLALLAVAIGLSASAFAAGVVVPAKAETQQIKFAIVADQGDAPAIGFLQVDGSSLAAGTLNAAIQQLRAATQGGARVKTLYLVGHGGTSTDPNNPQGLISFGANDYGKAEIDALRRANPDLADLFVPDADVYMLNC